jgi:hypothetical protein
MTTTTMTSTTAVGTTATMTTEPPSAFDRAAAMLWLLAAVAGLAVGAVARLYVAPAAPVSAPIGSPPSEALATDAPTVVVVRRAAAQPVARTRAS